MKNSFTFTTDSGNRYYYLKDQPKVFQYCHPLFNYIFTLHGAGKDIEKWLADLPADNIDIGDHNNYTKEDARYYADKFRVLMENGLFPRNEMPRGPDGKLTGTDVKKLLANSRLLTFETTDRCNLSCAYCGYGELYSDYDKRENKNLNPEVAKTTLDYLLELWNSPLNTSHDANIYIGFYGGEPLLNFPFICEIVAYVNDLNAVHNRFTFAMTTNGLLLDKYIDFLAKHKFNLLVSLDGNEEHNGYRFLNNGKTSYKKLMANLELVRTNYPEYFEKHVEFNAVLHNKNSVSQVHRYFKETFGKLPGISDLNISGIAESKREKFLATYLNIYEDLSRSENYSEMERDWFIKLPTIQGAGTFLFKYSGYSFNDYKDLVFSENRRNSFPTGTCAPFSKKIFVTVKGKILPCERIGHSFALGHVDQNKVSLDFDQIADIYNDYLTKLGKQCEHCYERDGCRQCIFYLNIHDPKPRCNGFMNADDFARYFADYFSYFEKNPDIYAKIMKEVAFE